MPERYSKLMRLFLAMGLERIAWSLRRLWCPVNNDSLVLEVGSGGNPYYRANVLLDAYEESQERHWQELVRDRPIVLGFVERLPFRDKSFDFVIASHVLEHSTDPSAFLSELQRVAKAGYIEVPDALMERLNPYHDHRLEITEREGKLVIRKKKDWQADSELVELYESRLKPILTSETMCKHPFDFHVRYYWKENIQYEVLNPEVKLNWQPPTKEGGQGYKPGLKARLSQLVLQAFRKTFSQSGKNRRLDISKLLQCPKCRSNTLDVTVDSITCQDCKRRYPCKNGMPVMIASES